MFSIEEHIYQNSKEFPEKVAIKSGDNDVSYSLLWEEIVKASELLKRNFNIRSGDRVILASHGSVGFIYFYFGVHLAGGVAVPIDPDTNQTRFEYIYKSTNPKVVIGTLNNIQGFKIYEFDDIQINEAINASIEPKIDCDKVADILFTTGTTGSPKGVMLSYSNEAAAARNINDFIKNNASDIELLALPVSHSFGLGRLRCVLSVGGQLILLGTFANMKRFFGSLKNNNVTGFAMVPASWNIIKKMSGNYIERFADQLRYIEIGSSFMSIDDKELLLGLLPNTRICMHYGSTEASRSAFMEFHIDKNNLSSAGKATPGCEIKILSMDGSELPPNQEGELCVKGPHVMCGYWQESKEQRSASFHRHFFRTGDCATMDENGNIYLKSRIKEIINVGGKKVAPMEIEDVLNSIPQIRESACVAIPDPDGVLGEVVKAFIVENGPIQDEQIRNYLKEHLETYKLPVQIERINLIPKTSSGKIQRLSLQNGNK